MRDPYGKGFPGVSDPADNLVSLARDDDNDIGFAVKALRITNETAAWISIKVVTVIENIVTLRIPPNCVWVEPIRITRLFETGSDAAADVSGYTDLITGEEVKLT